MQQEKFAIRFGLGALKAVGSVVMENAVKERKEGGKFKDVYDFAERLDPRSINKKSIEALAKAGAFDSLHKNRCQIAESFDVLSSYSAERKNAASSNQMSLFSGMLEENFKPELKKVSDWNRVGRLQKEFEAFGFFLNEHPLDEHLPDLKKRGVIFSDKLERDELVDGNLVKMAGVVAASKHRSSARGRFANMSISDPFGIFEAMIFDEAVITSARDILVDGSAIAIECLVRRDEGGVRLLIREVKKLDDFIRNTKPAEKDFEDIKQQAQRSFKQNRGNYQEVQNKSEITKTVTEISQPKKEIFSKVEIFISSRDPIFSIKALLSQRLAPVAAEKFTKIFFLVGSGEKVSRVELDRKYFLNESDMFKIRALAGVVNINTIF